MILCDGLSIMAWVHMAWTQCINSESERSKGAREGNFKGGILRLALASIQYIHKPSHNAALAIDSVLLQMKNSEQVPLVYIINSVYCLAGG